MMQVRAEWSTFDLTALWRAHKIKPSFTKAYSACSLARRGDRQMARAFAESLSVPQTSTGRVMSEKLAESPLLNLGWNHEY
jgi:hypothetical protein